MKSFRIAWDRDYGINKRTGWSVTYDGSVLSQLEPWFVVAIWKAWRTWRLWEQ